MEVLRIQESGQSEEVFACNPEKQKGHGRGEEQGVDAVEDASMPGQH
jgi:hypothetical protein